MWVKVNLTTFAVEQRGFAHTSTDGRHLYVTEGSQPLRSIAELSHAEYVQAIEINPHDQSVTFGRDYLGHYALLYGFSSHYLFISDDLTRVKRFLETEGVCVQLSEEAIALYFSMGYVPHGKSVYKQIVNCEAAALYCWKNGAIKKTRVFRPIETDPKFTVANLAECIEGQVTRWGTKRPEIDVWCSGGLDSSIMAYCFNSSGRRADLLTLGYGDEIHAKFGDGERSYAQEVARSCGTGIREVSFDREKFGLIHEIFTNTHNCPVFDVCVPPKYALAEVSRPFVVTGEGSDNLFGGPKNNQILFALAANPSSSLGWLYALAHKRFVERLPEILVRGPSLTSYVVSYFDDWLNYFPGDLVRKLIYMNLMLKAASMIFAQSYYASRVYNITVRHPFASLAVYEAAFRLADEHKYRYPNNKLCLIELYQSKLPRSIIARKKSGTVLPLQHYLHGLPDEKFEYSELAATDFFTPSILERMSSRQAIEADPLLVYALVTLNQWLKQRGENYDVEHIPTKTRDHQRCHAGIGL